MGAYVYYNLQMVKQQFGEDYTVDERCFYFDTKEEPSIRVKYTRETPELWSLTNEGTNRQVYIIVLL